MPNKEWALAYGRIGWPVFPVTGYKTPYKGTHGHLDATTDPAQIEAWWTARPKANIGLACGDVVVIDADGASAVARLKAIGARHGGFPRTAMVKTGRGIHLYFKAPAGVRIGMGGERRVKAGDDGIDWRGHGGWAVLPPSVNAKNGFTWKWISPLPLADLPDWLMPEISPAPINRSTALTHFGNKPAYLQTSQRNIEQVLSENLKVEYSPSEHARLQSALQAISANGYYDWINVGMALKTLDWERSDGTSLAFELYDAWSATCPEKYSQAATEAKWNSFKRSGVSIGTIYHLAQQAGWSGIPDLVAAPQPKQLNGSGQESSGESTTLNGHANGAHALPAAFTAARDAIFFPDRTEEGKTRATMLNTKVAIGALEVDCRYDLFHNRMLVAGEVISKWCSSELSDHVVSVLRDTIRGRFGFDPGKQNTQDAAETLCLNRMFDPVLDYLDSLQWDRAPRLDCWMVTYLGAADTELNHAIGRLSLIAAVRRARRPGTKFDQIIVLEGPQGQGKSEAIEILAGPENFSDQSILGVDDRKQQELTEGVWLYEIGELHGIRRTDIEHIKAFASRKVDRARPAYGRYMVSQPRRTVFFASCNRPDYLQDDTGNRRFWPVAVSRIDLVGLRRDRDQLWAEAAHREAQGETHYLPERLWRVAGEVQADRMEADEWADAIANYIALKELKQVSIMQVLTDNQFLQLSPGQVGQKEQSRAARVLLGLGFQRHRDVADKNGRRPWRYRLPGT